MRAPLLSRRVRFGLGLDGSSSGLIRPEAEAEAAAGAIDGRSSRMEGGTVLGAYPFQRQPGAAAAKPSNEGGSSEGQVVPLDKQPGNTASIIAPPAKRVAETSMASSRDNSLSSDTSNKRLKIEYKCSLCQVTATCEQGLLDHINGRKHRAKESADNFQKMAEGSGSSSQHQNFPTNNNGTPKHKTGVLQIIERGTDTKEPEDSKETNGGNCLTLFMVKQPGNMTSIIAPPAKRVAETSMASSRDNSHSSDTSNKRLKIEYKCSLCQVTATCEQGLLDHINGRKHKAKESADNFQKMAEGSGSSSQHQNFPTNNGGTPKHKTGVLQIIERGAETKEPEDSKETNGGDEDDVASEESEKEMPSEYRNSYKCWCVICSIGTTSEALMEAHCGGKKHKHALLKNGGGLVVIKTTPDLVADQKDVIKTTPDLVADQKDVIKTTPDLVADQKDAVDQN